MFDFLLSKEQLAIREEVREFVSWVPKRMILDMDKDKISFPKEFLAEAGKRHLFGCRYPKKWGGRGMDWVTACMVLEEVGVLGYIFACIFGVGAELVCDAIIQHGTDEQRERYVLPVLRGEKFAAECLTEPRGGSDFFGATTVASDKGDYFVLNGQKRFIVGAEGADYFLVYARTITGEGNEGDSAPTSNSDQSSHQHLSCFIVDRGPGVRVEYLYGLMGCRGGGTGRLAFHNVEIPKENLLGAQGGGKAVFDTMMIPERLGTAAMTIGATAPVIDVATGYTSRRKAFGQIINQFEGVSFQVADSVMLLDTARAMVYTTALAVDKGLDVSTTRRLISETKKFVTQSCQEVTNKAMQVMGGIGYTNVFPIERTFRDIRLASIWTGTNEMMSLIVAHEWYKQYAQDARRRNRRNVEADAEGADADDEKIYE
ncbi:MAG: acyl-CoA/acyl-ACP dehydrogenase [Actinobacteria bacterium]|nr:acyl-CoA/acyl-ACP dehydrogenase [Actinomycetota bacterium]MCL6104348.1 acyl-CoA/acyl-ACP dehydrogenase [Actinomycetota bacterium]